MLFKSATSRNMALIAGSGLIATVAATGLLLSFAYDNIRDASITEMRQIAGSYAADIERSMSTGVELTANLRSGLTAMKKGGDADRARADLLLKTVLEDSPSVLGTWTGWEPNAFDGKDADFVGKEGHDATGRYVPYWVRNSGKISHQALIDYTIPGNGDYYQLAFTQRKTVIVEPYLYDIGGEKVAMTSIATPILWEGKAVGVAGMDISRNPGLTATLYNIGNSKARARALAAKNAGGATVWPEENYYGWLINDKLAELQALL